MLLHELSQLIYLRAAEVGAAWCAEALDDPAGFGDAGEDLEAAISDDRRHIHEFEAKAHVGLVGAEAG